MRPRRPALKSSPRDVCRPNASPFNHLRTLCTQRRSLIPFLFLQFRTLFHSTEGGANFFPTEDNMNQQTITNPSFTSNSSASNLSLVNPDVQPVAPADSPVPKAATRKSKLPAKASVGGLIPHAPNGESAAAQADGRCRHFTATGRRCRLSILDPASGLCFRHAGLQFQPSDEDLSTAFGGLLTGLQSACGIHDFLSQLTVLLVQNRISTRRAAILAYLGQTLLRTLPAIQDELEPEPQIIFDLPRPKRDDDISSKPDGCDRYTSEMDKSK